jgi:uncharacterized protein (TIGR02246 family)
MKTTWTVLAAVGLLAGLAAGLLVSRGPSVLAGGEAPKRPADEKAIREAAQAFARAFEKGDAKAVGAFFTDEGEYLDEGGEPVRGRAALEKAYADFFAQRKELKVEGKTDAIRFLGKDTAVEEGTFTVHARGSPPHASRYSALYVRQDGRWLMALLKEWGDDTTDRPSLNDLAWLIGTWESEGDQVQARTTYEWDDNKKFIRGKYTITNMKDKAAPGSGTQVLGVDPNLGLIRAWTFDSEGGFGESFWTWDGERWVIDSSGTLAGGSETTALNFLARSGDDAFTWRSAQRTLDGEQLPDLGPVKVKRVAPGK